MLDFPPSFFVLWAPFGSAPGFSGTKDMHSNIAQSNICGAMNVVWVDHM